MLLLFWGSNPMTPLLGGVVHHWTIAPDQHDVRYQVSIDDDGVGYEVTVEGRVEYRISPASRSDA